MKVAAPKYLGERFKDAPPGHRHSLYFQYWQPGSWSAYDKDKTEALGKLVKKLPDASSNQLDALNERSKQLFNSHAEQCALRLVAKSRAPMMTGIGIAHPLENGFAFLNPYGLPYLPGSGIKGVLRAAALELCETGEAGWTRAAVDSLFGTDEQEQTGQALRGALTFWDVIPKLQGDALSLDGMTPHASDYYRGVSTPHEAAQPNPVSLIVIPTNSGFTFQLTLNEAYVAQSLKDGAWKSLLEAAMQHAFEWLGFGAKTSLGYGEMQLDQSAQEGMKEELENQRQAQAQEAQIEDANQGLEKDAQQINARKLSGKLQDNSDFLDFVENLFGEYELLSAMAIELLLELAEQKWPSICSNPDATQGKKNKAKFKPRISGMVKKLLEMGKRQA